MYTIGNQIQKKATGCNYLFMPVSQIKHDDVIKWTHLPRYRPFVRGIHRSPVNSLHKAQWLHVSFDLHLNENLSKQSSGWWIETPSHSLWRHRNDVFVKDTQKTATWPTHHHICHRLGDNTRVLITGIQDIHAAASSPMSLAAYFIMSRALRHYASAASIITQDQ